MDVSLVGLDEDVIKTQPCFCGAPNCAKVIGGKRKELEDGDKRGKKRKRKTIGKQTLIQNRLLERTLGSDSFCSICGTVGVLLMCDGRINGRDCPRCYHPRYAPRSRYLDHPFARGTCCVSFVTMWISFSRVRAAVWISKRSLLASGFVLTIFVMSAETVPSSTVVTARIRGA